MTAKEKANELFDKYNELLSIHIFNGTFDIAKQSALIAVDEMLNNDGWSSSPAEWSVFKKYCEEVKQELLKL